MGLNTFSAALSGLSTNSQGLNVVGNNLANLNTVGFKTSNISFTDVLGQTFSTSGTAQSGRVMTIGLGAQVAAVRASMAQGSIQTTNNPLDVAIQGKGFLVVKNSDGQFYTRAGNLHLDANGFVVADNGAEIQGYVRNPATGLIDSNLGMTSIKLPAGIDSPVVTSTFELAMNLDADAPTGTQFSTPVQLYDSLGTAHMATLEMQKDISGGTVRWRFDVTIPNNEINGVASTNTDKFSLITGAVVTGPPAGGALVFDTSGNLSSAYVGADPSTLPPLADLKIPPTGVTMPAMANGGTLSPGITWTLLSSPTTSNITGFATGKSAVTGSVQNGAAAGQLSNLFVLPDGTISAVFNNGNTTEVAQIVLAQFNNIDGLISQGGGLYAESIASGSAFFGAPGDGGRGSLMGAALEQSNVDMAAELTKIITFQRGYQANARMITVTDQIMQETMNMRQ